MRKAACLLGQMDILEKGSGKLGRRYGSSFQADIHVQVDRSLSVAEGHDIGHAVKEAVVGAGIDVDDVVVHVEPWGDGQAV